MATPLLAALNSADESERFAALGQLSDLAADAYGRDAVNLSELIREADGIRILVECMNAPGIDVQQCAMSLLGNLLTDVFDPKARLSLKHFAAAGGLASLQAKLSAQFPINLFAAAALQNVTALDPEECCERLRSSGCDAALTGLATSDSEQVATYAQGALANLRAYDPSPPEDPALEEALRLRRLRDVVEAMQTRRATDKMQFYGKRWIERHRGDSVDIRAHC